MRADSEILLNVQDEIENSTNRFLSNRGAVHPMFDHIALDQFKCFDIPPEVAENISNQVEQELRAISDEIIKRELKKRDKKMCPQKISDTAKRIWKYKASRIRVINNNMYLTTLSPDKKGNVVVKSIRAPRLLESVGNQLEQIQTEMEQELEWEWRKKEQGLRYETAGFVGIVMLFLVIFFEVMRHL